MNTVIQYLINRAGLDVTLIQLTGATKDSFTVTVESRVTGTGFVSSTISSVELELTFNGSCFGKLTLPEVKTSVLGTTKVKIKDQRVQILDAGVFRAYLQSLIRHSDTNFQLENGECTIRSLGIVAECSYCLDIPVRGMGGPASSIKEVKRNCANLTVHVEVDNPSPVEVDYGHCRFELLNKEDETIAELIGSLNMVRGPFVLVLDGQIRDGAVAAEEVRLRGVDVVGEDTWRNQTVKYFDVVLELDDAFADLLCAV